MMRFVKRIRARCAAPTAERPDARPALVIDDVVGVASRITRSAFRRGKAGQPEPGADFDQHVLKRPNVAVRSHYRLTDSVGRPFDPADRAIVSEVFMAEFQAMLAIYMKRVSI